MLSHLRDKMLFNFNYLSNINSSLKMRFYKGDGIFKNV